MGSCYICLIFYVIECGAVAWSWTENETSLRVTVRGWGCSGGVVGVGV